MRVVNQELSAETLERMRPLWAAADRALRTDTGVLVEIAERASEVKAAMDGRTPPAPPPPKTPEQRARYRANARAAYAARKAASESLDDI